MKYVPYFCNSHLIAKGIFSATTLDPNPAQFIATQLDNNPLRPIFSVLNVSDINKAITMANNSVYHRDFDFGRTNGHWTINGETWDTMKIAAEDVGQNTWELWRFKSGGGWFHPVHVHLVDFFVIKREGNTGLRTNEFLSPKDVFYLGPGNTIYVIARFGAHKGDYMFHCHNLIHEDNDMMRAFRVIDSKQGLNGATSKPFVINKLNNVIYNNWKYSDPLFGDTAAKPSKLVRTMSDSYVNLTLSKNLYRIFYPLQADIVLMNGTNNPWQSKWCPI